MEEELSQEDVQQPQQKREKKTYKRGILTGVLITLAVILGVTMGAFAYFRSSLGRGGLLNASVKTKIEYLAAIINYYYYDDIDTDAMADGLYKGLVESTGDRYSTYYTAEEYKEMMIDTTGNYAGIGALLSQNTNTKQVIIIKVYDGSPAAEAGLMAGDEIVSADGYTATDYSLDDFVKHIRGEEGSQVSLNIIREEEEQEYTVTRANVTVPSVSYQILDNQIAYMEITEFSSNTQEQFEAALADLESQGMKSIIFDLRSNGGGLVDSVTAILDDILPEGTTVYMKDKNGKETDYTSDEEHQINYPMVVLTSENTASAAEIFAGAIRDFHYGTLIGVTTFGKGIVQTTLPLSDGSAIKLTTATYYTPSGECIHGVGIKPDIQLEYQFLGGEDDKYALSLDNQVQKAIEVLK